MESPRYDYGSGAGTSGKIRRHRAVAASPYARPATSAPETAPATVSQGGGWFSRFIAAGTSRLLPSLFRTSPAQLTAPAPPPHELPEPSSRDQLLVDAPPSPLPPPLEDDLPECEENSGVAANNLCTKNSSSKGAEENMLRNSGDMALEELLKQKTFARSEFEYLANLLWSKTIGANSLKPEDGNIRKMIVYDKENGSEHSNLPLDFSATTYHIDDQVASPPEIAKAYMCTKSSKGTPLRLRLHDPSSMTITSIEASMSQKAKPPTIPLAQASRLHTSTTSDRLESNYTSPNGAIYKMSSSPYFKSGVSSKELFGSVSSHYQTSSSVQTFGRQVLKRKITAISNESVSTSPIRRMHQRYDRTSPLLETRLGYRRYPVGYGRKLEGPEQLAQTQKRRCLDKVVDASLCSIENRAHVSCFGQAPEQSAEMAAKILKQLDTLVPLQKENTPEVKQQLESAIYFEDVSRQKKVQAERDLLGPSPSEVEYSLSDGITSNKSISQITLNKEKPPLFSFRGNAPNFVISDEIGRNKMSTLANGFTFPVPTVNNAHSQGPPTPTLASPPILTVEKQPSLLFSASVTSAESGPRISKSVLGGAVTQKLDSKLNADDQQMPSKNSGQGASFTSNPVFKVDGPGYASNSIVSGIPSNTSIGSASFQSAGSSTISISLASKCTPSCSTGGSLTFSDTGFGSLSAATNMFAGSSSEFVAVRSFTSSCTGSPSVAFGFPAVRTASSPAVQHKSEAANRSTTFSSMQQFGIAGSYTIHDKSEAVDNSTPFGFSQKFHTASSASEDMSKAASAELTFFSGNHNAQSKNCSSLFTQSPANNLCFKSTENLNSGSSHSFVDSHVGSATIGSSPFNSSSLFSWAAAACPTSVTGTAPPSSPATSSSFAFSSRPSFLAQPVSSSKLTTPAPPSFGSANTGPATLPFGPMPSAVFSFTSATPSIPNPPTPIFGDPLVHTNGGNMVVDRNGSPSPATSPFGLPSSSPSTASFSTPATQFASSTSGSPGAFEVGQHSQISSGGFSMGPSGGTDKSSRRIIRVKRRK